jgi:hypothetical protein
MPCKRFSSPQTLHIPIVGNPLMLKRLTYVATSLCTLITDESDSSVALNIVQGYATTSQVARASSRCSSNTSYRAHQYDFISLGSLLSRNFSIRKSSRSTGRRLPPRIPNASPPRPSGRPGHWTRHPVHLCRAVPD